MYYTSSREWWGDPSCASSMEGQVNCSMDMGRALEDCGPGVCGPHPTPLPYPEVQQT